MGKEKKWRGFWLVTILFLVVLLSVCCDQRQPESLELSTQTKFEIFYEMSSEHIQHVLCVIHQIQFVIVSAQCKKKSVFSTGGLIYTLSFFFFFPPVKILSFSLFFWWAFSVFCSNITGIINCGGMTRSSDGSFIDSQVGTIEQMLVCLWFLI